MSHHICNTSTLVGWGVAGTQDSYVAGSSGKDKEPTQEYILLPLHPHRTRIPVEDVALVAHENPSESSPKDNDVQDSEDVAEKEGQHQMTEDEQVLHDDLKKMIAQEVIAKALDDATRQAFEEEKRNIASQKRAAQTTSITKLSTGRSYCFKNNKYDASTLPNADLPIDPNMPDLEDDSDAFSSDGIFNGAYDDENVGAMADFNNMDDTINVSPIPTLRIHKNHPKDQILGDPKSAVQTRAKIQKLLQHNKHQESKNIYHLYKMKSGLKAMQEELPVSYGNPKEIQPFELEAFSDSDYGGASLDRKSTTGGCQFLGRRLISWQCKKQTIVANSTTKAEYVAAANCDEGAVSKRPSETQPTPSPPHPSADQHETQPDPSLRPSPTIPIPDSIPEIKQLKKKAKPVISHHNAWITSVSIKKRLAQKKSLQKKWMQKESDGMAEGSWQLLLLFYDFNTAMGLNDLMLLIIQ
ncbi:hypothetical protein Tco_0620124 [Tanacetum coccineum]